MAQVPKPDLSNIKRVADYNPDVAVGEVLDPIANTDVLIWSVTFDQRNGKKGPYILAVVEVTSPGEDRADSAIYHTGGAVVVERLAAMFGITVEQLGTDYLAMNRQPDGTGVFPVLANFSKEKSASNPGQSYWTVG